MSLQPHGDATGGWPRSAPFSSWHRCWRAGKRTLAAGGYDGTVRRWEAPTGKPIGQPLTGHTGGVTSLAFSPDGSKIASAGTDGTVRLWQASTGKPIGQPLTGHTGGVTSLAFSPD